MRRQPALAGDRLGLDLVDHQHVERTQHLGRHRGGGRHVEHGPRTQALGADQGREGLLGADLVLAQDGDAGAQQRVRHLRRGGVEIGAAGDDDRVLAALVDADHGDGRGPRRDGQQLAVDPGLEQQVAHRGAVGVRTDMADEADLGPGLGGGGGLVGALAARGHDVAWAEHGLARPRQARHLEQRSALTDPGTMIMAPPRLCALALASW